MKKLYLKNKFNKLNTSNKLLLKNVFFIILLRIFVIIYTIIRIFLVNYYLGVENYGLLNIMISITPIALIFMSGSQSKSLYVLYPFAIKKDFQNLNKVISEQVKEMHYYFFISIFFVGFLMIISYLFFNSPGLNGYTASLLVFANSIEFLSFGVVVPVVYWFLNSIYKNYIYDIFSILFSTIGNIISFILIYLFGIHIIKFENISYEEGSTYIVLIMTFLLTFRYFMCNIVLNIMKKRYMPWYKKVKTNYKVFNKNSNSYIIQQLLANLISLMIPIFFYVFAFFSKTSTLLSGIYYSYLTFIVPFQFLTFLLSSLKPYLAKYFFSENSSNSLFLLNKLMFKVLFITLVIFQLNYVLITPYVVYVSKSYFSFIIAFFIGINAFITSLKSVDEDFIYIHGKPEKYFLLTLYEIIICSISIIVGSSCIFCIWSFNDIGINLLLMLLICEFITKISKFLLNIVYSNKNIFKVTFKEYIKSFYPYFLFFILYFIAFIIIINKSLIFIDEEKNITINNPILDNIQQISAKNTSSISWLNMILLVIFSNLLFIPFILLFFYITDKKELSNLITIVKNTFKPNKEMV